MSLKISNIVFSQSRNLLIAPHCNPLNSDCLDILTTAYHTLLCATLLTWSPPHPLTPTAFAEFVQSVLRALPSSSSTSPKVPTHVSIFGDHLVDMIWAVDMELDELLNEARIAATAAGEGKLASKDVANLLNKAKRAQSNAETDKQRIPAIVMKLLVWDTDIIHTLVNSYVCIFRNMASSAPTIVEKDWNQLFWPVSASFKTRPCRIRKRYEQGLDYCGFQLPCSF